MDAHSAGSWVGPLPWPHPTDSQLSPLLSALSKAGERKYELPLLLCSKIRISFHALVSQLTSRASFLSPPLTLSSRLRKGFSLSPSLSFSLALSLSPLSLSISLSLSSYSDHPSVALAPAADPAPAATLGQVMALFDLASGRPGELVLQRGEALVVTARVDGNWFSYWAQGILTLIGTKGTTAGAKAVSSPSHMYRH